MDSVLHLSGAPDHWPPHVMLTMKSITPAIYGHGLRMVRTTPAVVIILALVLYGAALGKENFLSQEFVDSTIQRAFFNFNTAVDLAATRSKQGEAIAEAKEVAARLKRMAKDDPNEKYVLWRVGELEWLIWLEENDAVLAQQQEKQKAINELVPRFNSAVGKRRPNFRRLNRIHAQMKKIDPDKAAELEWLVDDRNRNISREVYRSIQAALNRRDLALAREELEYCRTNLGLLRIPLDDYNRFLAVLRSKIRANDQKGFIDNDLKKVPSYLGRNALGQAWNAIYGAQARLSSVKRDLTPREYARYSVQLKEHIQVVEQKEDSLVDENIAVFNTEGTKPAIRYMERVVRRSGVSYEKVAQLDRAIMEATRPTEEGTEQYEFSALERMPDNQIADMNELRMAAKRKAQERADSLREAEEKRNGGFGWRIRKRREERRRKEKEEMQRKRRQRLRMASQEASTRAPASAHADPVASVSSTPDKPHAPPPVRQAPRKVNLTPEQAEQAVVDIYSLIERGQSAAAYVRFQHVRDALKRHMEQEQFKALKTATEQAYSYQQSR